MTRLSVGTLRWWRSVGGRGPESFKLGRRRKVARGVAMTAPVRWRLSRTTLIPGEQLAAEGQDDV
jgi:hypothetical protein